MNDTPSIISGETPPGMVVYRLVSELNVMPDEENDSGGGKEEQDESPSLATHLEDINRRDVSTHLGDHGLKKRTTITPRQKAILEEFYANGMTSSGMLFGALHQAAAQKTRLSVQTIQHWIRNRRRPVHKEKGASDNHKSLDSSYSTYAITLPTSSSPTSLADSNRVDHIKNCDQSPSEASPISSQLTVTSPGIETTATLTVKCRIADSIEKDFVEVEVPSLTYETLLQSCCEELEVESASVVKIRKLPNILVRKDKDVMRLNALQELELVLPTHVAS